MVLKPQNDAFSRSLVVALIAVGSLALPAPPVHADALKGAVIGAGVGALVGGKKGARNGAIVGAIAGGVKRNKKKRR
jgi:hypothetical protein